MENTPISLEPQKSPKSSLKYLMILLAVLALGFLAYWLARGDFFKGFMGPEDPGYPLFKAETALEEVGGFVAINESPDNEDFDAWPLESLKESSFKVLDFDPLDATVSFGSEVGYGTWRALRADFNLLLSSGTLYVDDTSTATNTEITSRCAVVYTENGEVSEEELCFEPQGNQISFDVRDYSPGGNYIVKLNITDADGRSDETTKQVNIPDQSLAPASVGGLEISAGASEADGVNYNFFNLTTIHNGNLLSAAWDFGDGESVTLEDAELVDNNGDNIIGDTVHKFDYSVENPAEYNVTLTVLWETLGDLEIRSEVVNDTVEIPVAAPALEPVLEPVPEPVAEPAAEPEPIIEPLKANFDCGIIKQNNATQIVFLDKSTAATRDADVFIKFTDGTPPIQAKANKLKDKVYEISDVNREFSYNIVEGEKSDSLEVTAEGHCRQVQQEDNRLPLQPVAPFESRKQGDNPFFGLNVFNALQANAFGSDMGIDWLEATPGSTVYFEAGCKAGEDKVMISTPTDDVALFDINQNGDTCEDETDPIVLSQCSDTEDNDNDGKTDFVEGGANNDPGCENAEDDNETDPVPVPDPMQCSNQQDDDSDGKIDFGNANTNDPGCESPEDNEETDPANPTFQCSDGADNDSDGKIDHPADPGCDSGADDNEADAVVNPGGNGTPPGGGNGTPDCNDGADNDNDGHIDFGRDPGCDTPSDDNEYNVVTRETDCSDRRDNDNDGFTDTEDPGCEDAADDSEENQKEQIKKGEAKLPECLAFESPQDFDDLDDEDLEEIVMAQSSTAYYGDYDKFEGNAIFVGYEEDGERLFKGDQPIRRDEAVKIIEIATCYPDYLSSKKKISSEKLTYLDAEFKNTDYWATYYIRLAAQGGIADKKKSEFYPGNRVTRAEFLKMLMTMYSQSTGKALEQCKTEKTAFVDVSKGDWFCSYFKTANTLGIAQGTEDKKGNLRAVPNRFLTRAEAAVWLHNYFVTIGGKNYADDLEEETENKIRRR